MRPVVRPKMGYWLFLPPLARVADVRPHRRVRETRRQRKDKETGSNAQAHFGSPFEHDVESTPGYSLIGRHICEM